jgi:uncharacterized protein (DUF1697 family)
MIHIALLRGINVGGRNKLPMKELAAIFTDLGGRDVRTYIQSGNVVFGVDEALAADLPPRVSDAIAARHGLEVPVVLRTAGELSGVLRDNPFLAEATDPRHLGVMFLADEPDEAARNGLDPDRSPGDSFQVRGREIYLHLPNGVARSKLTNAWFDRQLGTICTGRNWRTVSKLVAMAGG